MLSYITNKMKIKVLYVVTGSDIGGAQKYAADLADSLNKKQFEVKIIYGGKDVKWLSNKITPWTLFLNDWLAIFELAKIYKKEKPDIIHLNSSKAGVVGSLAAYFYNLKAKNSHPAKVMFTAHGWVFNPTNALLIPERWLYILLHKFTARFQDKIICVSGYDYKLALRYKIAPETKLTNIHNGIRPNIPFLDRDSAKKELQKKLHNMGQGAQINMPWVGSIGRLTKEKDYQTFISAAALIPGAYFFLIGSGPEHKKLKAASEKLKIHNKFFILPPTGEDHRYLKAFDIFVMSSIKEGLPYILLEAMAAELPIVVTETGGIPEMIKNHENGLMVAQKNPELLAKAVQGLIANKNISDEIKKVAKKVARENFSLKKMADKTTELYETI